MTIIDIIIKTVTDSENYIKALSNTSDKGYGPEITLTDNEIKDIINAVMSLKNKGILLKGTTRKITTLEGGFSNFLEQ